MCHVSDKRIQGATTHEARSRCVEENYRPQFYGRKSEVSVYSTRLYYLYFLLIYEE